MPNPDPPCQRHSDTSRAAAEAIKPCTGAMRQAVYNYLLRNGPATDEEMQEGIPMSQNGQRPRRCELVAAGLVEDSRERRKTRAGKKAVVWRIRVEPEVRVVPAAPEQAEDVELVPGDLFGEQP